MFSIADHTYMTRALQLAELGMNTTTPNPRVGCVIVKDGKVIGEGAHLKAGEPHAEVFAIRQAGDQAKGATLYVTLEPCNHTGRTPPCSQAIVDAGIAKVIVAMQDPNPQVAGSGLAHLQAHNIEVASGLMQVQAEALNPGFISRMTKNKPFLRCKIAASLDGKTALNNGASQWITSEPARLDVQHWRARSCAILTGIGTVFADNPSMTVRTSSNTPSPLMGEAKLGASHRNGGEGVAIRQPLRIVVDSQLQTPIDAKILQGGNVLIAFASDTHNKSTELLKAGAELLCIPNEEGKVCLKTLLSHLAACEINEVLVEAGEGLNGALLAQNLIDELLIYYAPKLMGSAAKGMLALPALTAMQQVIDLQIIDMRQIGVDIRLRAKPVRKT
jgi:diaminohydroxyphosphoribosylaminopyrimidine deaminase / 5-amino-6-(5-phosphoribosylamino)uracil reductase